MEAVAFAYRCVKCGQGYTHSAGTCALCKGRGTVTKDAGSVMLRSAPELLSEIKLEDEIHHSTGVEALDLALYGGTVPGFSILASGEPGMGKSTLFLEAACRGAKPGTRRLYATSEERKERIAQRATRLELPKDSTIVYAESEGERILEELKKRDYDLLVLDSVQTTSFGGRPLGSPDGSKELVRAFHKWAQENGKVAVLICQETKDDGAAGPLALQHYVDCLLELEGPRMIPGTKEREPSDRRHLVTRKNRAGVAPVVVDLVMTGRGLEVWEGEKCHVGTMVPLTGFEFDFSEEEKKNFKPQTFTASLK